VYPQIINRRSCKLPITVAMAKYHLLAVFYLQKQLSQRQSTAPLEAVATAGLN